MRRACRPSLPGALFAALLLWGAPVVLRAQFGTVELSTVIPTSDFNPQNSTITFFNEGFTYLQITGGSNTSFLADVDLPPGANITNVCAFAKDNDATGEVFLDLSVVELGSTTIPTVTTIASAGTGIADTKGYHLFLAAQGRPGRYGSTFTSVKISAICGSVRACGGILVLI